MKNYDISTRTQSELKSITCDCCKKEYDDVMETQEFLSYKDTAGYSSIFGDMNRLSLDLCQYCVKKLLGKYLRINNGLLDY